MARDEIYRTRDVDRPAAPFEFSEAVVKVFPDMIERSVPGYRSMLDLTPLLVRRAVQPGSRIYDLGCSLGAATLAARRAVQVDDVEIIAVDRSPDMVARCREVMAADNSRVPVEVVEADLLDMAIENASVVLVYYTLQFVPIAERDALVRRIHDGLRPGGLLVLAEKLAFEPPSVQDWLDTHHHDFKRSQGYSDLEIARKRQALENVLVPETRAQHHERLRAAGFTAIVDWFQCFNFAAIAAVRGAADG
ncbi:carboxy-S-adenosyl-L-methionine synthase CmoA [Wenzhouxiangella sp. XN79A]|uniref:carboxy-S-adenosyl-L-methionine synthase CmoA n=1 Tax=Wenzhouxiangella sp. XN79A TaxID=2724193 RepID=UPI00144A958B|nr:carboxy-S-adenosyl-L-methionine synthase CmoA [Wenzhouxiangella sp. XN79A]NKI33832.1 carboxy-S-adenosyl-L-methionine synthase CmoA [Wenzhouxiangella sp. XN79A]